VFTSTRFKVMPGAKKPAAETGNSAAGEFNAEIERFSVKL
jgi:hypothetical protein